MDSAEFFFSRRQQADALVGSLLGEGLADHGSGLFLAAPRRTGKSTFLRRDLVPSLSDRRILPVYVDLWSDRAKDPADLIFSALRQAILDNGRPAAKIARNIGLTKVGLGSFASFDMERLGKPDGLTLADALNHLRAISQKQVALIIDEAQHALTSKAGSNAMFGLKAARDAMNQNAAVSGERGLLLVFTGSNRDKLASLVARRDQPFFGASITSFPLLGRGFTEAFTKWINKRLAANLQFDEEAVLQAFIRLGHRPELLRTAVVNASLRDDNNGTVNDFLTEEAEAQRRQQLEAMRQEIIALTAIQRAVLQTMAQQQSNFTPFKADTLKLYSALAGRQIETSDVQAALDSLRTKGLIWKSERGIYLLDDPVTGEILADHPLMEPIPAGENRSPRKPKQR
jgi:hypothetical protein